MLSLRDLQSHFFASIARTPGEGSGGFNPVLLQYVEGRGQFGAEDRVNIYAEMYYARLVDVLKSDFPRVAAILGCDRFHTIVSEYLARHPSTHPSLRYLGCCFPGFLQESPASVAFPFLSDLAALEWARVEVFDAGDAEPLRVEHLQSIDPDAWPTLRFQTIPAFQILQSEWPVHEIWHDAETEEALSRLTDIRPRKTLLRIWRQSFSVYHTKIDNVEHTALNCLLAGQPFASLCAALDEVASVEEAASAVGSLLLRWVEDGILQHSLSL